MLFSMVTPTVSMRKLSSFFFFLDPFISIDFESLLGVESLWFVVAGAEWNQSSLIFELQER